MKAKIKKDASAIFARKVNRMISGRAIWPKTYSDYYDTLKRLSGKTFVVSRTYGHRVVLKYPKRMVENNVVAIDLERDLVEMKKGKLGEVV